MNPNKKVNIFIQILLTFIPFGGLYAHYRIQKIRLGLIIAIISVAGFIIPVLVLPDYNDPLGDPNDFPTGYAIAMALGVTIWYFLPYVFLIKWSLDWNKRIDKESNFA